MVAPVPGSKYYSASEILLGPWLELTKKLFSQWMLHTKMNLLSWLSFVPLDQVLAFSSASPCKYNSIKRSKIHLFMKKGHWFQQTGRFRPVPRQTTPSSSAPPLRLKKSSTPNCSHNTQYSIDILGWIRRDWDEEGWRNLKLTVLQRMPHNVSQRTFLKRQPNYDHRNEAGELSSVWERLVDGTNYVR